MDFPISGQHINPLYLAVLGFVVGIFGGFFGVGGSFIAGPGLFVAGLPMNWVVGTDLAHIVGKSIVAMRGHLVRGNVDMQHLLNCRTSQQRTNTELRLKSKKGELIPALLCSTPINSMTRNGTLLYQTAIVDLTERKRFEEKVRRSEERYRTLFDLVPVAVYVCDADGNIQEYNRRAVELWGRDPGRNGEMPRFCGSYKIYYPDGRYMAAQVITKFAHRLDHACLVVGSHASCGISRPSG